MQSFSEKDQLKQSRALFGSTFVTRLCPSLKLYLVFEVQFDENPSSRQSQEATFFLSLDRILIASFQMYVVMKNRLDIQRSRKQICHVQRVNLLKALIHQKIYDFKTPQKKSTKMVFDGNSNISNKQIHARQEETWILNTSNLLNLLLLQNLYLIPI